MRLFDMHCDTLYECCKSDAYLDRNRLQVDLERGGRYAQWGQAFAVWMPDTLRGEAAFEQCRDMLLFAHDQAALYADRMQIIRTGEELVPVLQSGRCAAILTVEGGAALAGRLEHIDDLRELDVKVITVTWNGSNELGHGCLSGCEKGLTPFGRAAVRRMVRAGILPDVSHLNERGFWDVAECTDGAFLATHSVSAAVHAHPRNLTDRQFAEIRDRGGLVGLNFCADQLGEQTFDGIARHLDHYLSLGGEHTVALGCDLDGTSLPDGWGGIEVMERLYEALARQNVAQDVLDRVFFSNCVDFFASALTKGGAMR